MKRSINSTGRQRITHNMVTFEITRTANGDPVNFSANLEALKSMGLPTSARVSVEPYSGQSSMRFDFGAIGAMAAPKDTRLDEIDRGGEIIFRIKVIDDAAGKLGKLLASGDRIPASTGSDEGNGPLPLLPVKPEDLGERIWDVSTAHGPRPHLLVNSRIPDLQGRILSDPLLKGSILIEAFRLVLTAMLEMGDEPPWFDDWKAYVNDVLKVPFPEDLSQQDDDGERDALINDALQAFADRFHFASDALIQKKLPENTFHE